MKKVIELNESHSIELDASVGWLIVYRSNFGHDILPDIMPIIESFMGIAVEILQKSTAKNNKKKNEISISEIMSILDDDMVSDIFINLSALETITILQIIWSMAKKADKSILSFEEYFDQFDLFPMDMVIPEAIKLIIESSISSKKATSLLTMLAQIRDKAIQ